MPHKAAKQTGSDHDGLRALVADIDTKDALALTLVWRNHLGGKCPDHLPRWYLVRLLAYRLQAEEKENLDKNILRRLRQSGQPTQFQTFVTRSPVAKVGGTLTPGTILVRDWQGKPEQVTVLEQGFLWNGQIWNSLSQIAKVITGTSWNGHCFFGLKKSG